jgi:hypothetical protein
MFFGASGWPVSGCTQSHLHPWIGAIIGILVAIAYIIDLCDFIFNDGLSVHTLAHLVI